jgi:hypothetical protein
VAMGHQLREARPTKARSLVLLFIVIAIGSGWGALSASATEDDLARQVVLGKGGTKHFRWTATVVRDSGRLGGKRPCVGIDTSDISAKRAGRAPFESHTSVCSILKPGIPPNIVSVALGGDEPEATVLVIGAASSVVEVRLSVEDVGNKSVRLKSLTERQAKVAGVKHSNYAILVLKGARCIQQIAALNRAGKVTYKGPPESCGT